MALLGSFVSYLNEDERKLFAMIPLKGKEKKIRDTIHQQGINGIAKQELMKELYLSSTHFDKISAILLKKAYLFLAGEDDLAHLHYLSKKFMFNHLFHEIKNLKIKLQTGKISEDQKQKYLRAFLDYSINLPARYFDEKQAKQNLELYLQHISSGHEVVELEVETKLQFTRMNVAIQKCPDETCIEKIRKEILALEKKCLHADKPALIAVVLHSWINFYRVLQPNWRKRSIYLNKIKELYKEDDFPAFEKAVYECNQAEILFERGAYAKAFIAYNKAFAGYMPLLQNQFHHFARWIELSLILGLYHDAEMMLDRLFKVYVTNRHESNGVLGLILYSELYLMKGDFQKAHSCIVEAKNLNATQIYFVYEIRIRTLEALFFAHVGDHAFLKDLIRRSMRYISLHHFSSRRNCYHDILQLLNNLKAIKRGYPKKLSPKFNKLLGDLNHGFEKLNWLLLNKLFQKQS